MKKLEYIGPKADGERHLSERTGIVWKPGDVHEVSSGDAEELLKHPTSWRELAPAKLAAVPAAKPAPAASALPAWAKKGVELGATDDQLEAVAQAGGPETDAGAALWKDATGTDWAPAAKAEAKVDEAKPPAVKKAAAKKVPAKKAKAK